LRRTTPSSNPSAATGAEEADDFLQWWEWTAEVGELAVEVVRRWGSQEWRRRGSGTCGEGSAAGRGTGAQRQMVLNNKIINHLSLSA
jgi:hypothetical protein